jgi:GxxExxY protein
MVNLDRNRLNSLILNLAIEVHKNLGPGLPEEVYRHCFCSELDIHEINYHLNPSYTLIYKNTPLEHKIQVDILILPDTVVVIKAEDNMNLNAEAQLRALLKLTNLYTGIIINFNVSRLIEGFKKITNPV